MPAPSTWAPRLFKARARSLDSPFLPGPAGEPDRPRCARKRPRRLPLTRSLGGSRSIGPGQQRARSTAAGP
eukprot:2450530-Pyramimonas_sp.AAC.1